jgi:ethanolamine utilization protein EutP (predicted NTPase)
MEKIKVLANTEKNRLYIALSGSFDIEDTVPVINRINHEVAKLRPGFGVINDIRFLNHVDIAAAKRIKKGTTILKEHGAKHLVRVVGGSTLSIKIFAKFANLTKRGLKISYVPTPEEAEKILNDLNL